jgi:hypothetical protein
MNQGQKALGQLIGLTLAYLIGYYRHQRVMAAFGLNGNADPADGSGELPVSGLLLNGSEHGPEKPACPLEDPVGRYTGTMKVLHCSLFTVHEIHLVFHIVLDPQVRDLLLTHEIP